MLLALLLMVGATYGFALYVRDVVRAFRRFREGGDPSLWLPEEPRHEQADRSR